MSAKCDMVNGCLNPVTHIGEKGYVYCAEHVPARRHIERCRRMREWEITRIAAGKPLMSYEPITQAESEQREQHSASARLSAAAPELLVALEGLFEHCAMVHKHWGDGDNSKQADEAQRAAHAAIAKARGQS